MPWYWILIIISAIVGPFEAMHALNKARKNREAAMKRQERETETDLPRQPDNPGPEEEGNRNRETNATENGTNTGTGGINHEKDL